MNAITIAEVTHQDPAVTELRHAAARQVARAVSEWSEAPVSVETRKAVIEAIFEGMENGRLSELLHSLDPLLNNINTVPAFGEFVRSQVASAVHEADAVDAMEPLLREATIPRAELEQLLRDPTHEQELYRNLVTLAISHDPSAADVAIAAALRDRHLPESHRLELLDAAPTLGTSQASCSAALAEGVMELRKSPGGVPDTELAAKTVRAFAHVAAHAPTTYLLAFRQLFQELEGRTGKYLAQIRRDCGTMMGCYGTQDDVRTVTKAARHDSTLETVARFARLEIKRRTSSPR
jgi:hypothetical protein